MEECKLVIELLIKNQFEEAIKICEKWAKISLYHNHGKALLLFFKAILTLETVLKNFFKHSMQKKFKANFA
jgi:hypothetical protein